MNFLNQKPCIPSWPGVFQFDTFLSVVLSKSVCILAFGPSSSCSSSLVIWFIHSAFSLCCFGCHILVQNRSVEQMVFNWSLSDNKSPQISWNLLGILADFNNAVVWMVSSSPFISKSSSSFDNPLVTVPSEPIMIGINVTYVSHSFFSSLVRWTYLSFFSLSFNFTLWAARTAKLTLFQVVFFFIIMKSDHLADIK